MKTLKLSALFVLITILSFSCEKVDFNFADELSEIASNETEMLIFSESGFDIIRDQSLIGDQKEGYTAGLIEYKKDGILLASISFEEGKGKMKKDGKEYDVELETKENIEEGNEDKKGDWAKGKEKKTKSKFEYKKLVIEPIVKAKNCNYIVSGVIKYVDATSGDWVATIDFGDGTCDDIATKTTKDGANTFTISEYFD